MKVEVQGSSVHIATGSKPFDATGSRGVIVFVHGAGHDHTVWVMQTRYFARHGYAVLAPDLPDHGRSAGEALSSIEAMADWLDELLGVLKVETATVIGHSMGSLVTHAFAERHPARVQGIVLLGASVPMPVTDMLLDAAAEDDHAAIEMANTWSHSARGSLGGNPVPGLWVLGGGERLLERSKPGVFHTDLQACNSYHPEALAATPPATIVIGTDDKMTSMRAGRKVAAALGSTASVRTLPGSGHSMMSECPNEVLDILIEAVGV